MFGRWNHHHQGCVLARNVAPKHHDHDQQQHPSTPWWRCWSEGTVWATCRWRRPRGRFQDGDGGVPKRTSIARRSVLRVGTRSSNLATWPNSAVWRALMIAVTLGRPVFFAMAVLRIISCHITQRICLWKRMWKASRRMLSYDKRVHDSEPYKRTRTMHVK